MLVPDTRRGTERGKAFVDCLPPSRMRVRFIAPLARKTGIAWWEFESEIKRRLALEILMRRLFSLAPATA